MKTLIVYYSKTGNTERVAKDLSLKLCADLEQLIDQKKRSGILGWLTGGSDAMKKKLTAIEPVTKNPADYELVILGMPVWAWNLTPATRTYLEQHKNEIKNYAFFITSSNTPAEKLTPHFKTAMGKEPLCLSGFNEKELKDEAVYDAKLEKFINEIKS